MQHAFRLFKQLPQAEKLQFVALTREMQN